MLTQITGIQSVQKLYLQLLYRCNFNCLHCFHGASLQRSDRFSIEQVNSLLSLFTSKFGVSCLTLLGGEPFIYKDLPAVLELAKSYKLETAICTNGYRISKTLLTVAHNIDTLRVSMEGHRESNDHIRKKDSFDEAIKTLALARDVGLATSATVTITSENVREIARLAQTMEDVGVFELKLHQLRSVGNAKKNPELFCNDEEMKILVDQVAEVRKVTRVRVLLDDGLDTMCMIKDRNSLSVQKELERIEIQPDGRMYVSCKAVGSDSNAFWFNKLTGDIDYRPTDSDEVKLGVPQVKYLSLT